MLLRVLPSPRDYLPPRLFSIYLPCLTFSSSTKARNYTSFRDFRPDGGMRAIRLPYLARSQRLFSSGALSLVSCVVERRNLSNSRQECHLSIHQEKSCR